MAMDGDELFVRTVDELHRTINSSDEYEVLQAAKCLRQLLLDGGASLVDRVNRSRRLKISFGVVPQSVPEIPGLGKPDAWCVASALDPAAVVPGIPVTQMKRDSFLGMVIARAGGTDVSVGEVIKFVANVAGGVHLGDPRETHERALAEFRKLGIGMGIDPVLAMLRAIGRVTLIALRDLKDAVLSLERFENAPGWSFHAHLALYPMGTEEDNYIWDYGLEGKNRVSVYLDARGDLTARVVTATGERYLVRAGDADCAYRYGEPMHICCEVGQHQDELLVRLEFGGWYHCRTFKGMPPPTGDTGYHFVMGSDIEGKKHTNMAMIQQLAYSRILTQAERAEIRDYFTERQRAGIEAVIRFQGNQFLHSEGHPNFVSAVTQARTKNMVQAEAAKKPTVADDRGPATA